MHYSGSSPDSPGPDHDNLVIGDFSSNNVVDANGFVTFLDCDSIAFTDPATGELFPCLMHTTDYSPPSARRAARSAATDDFALAVLVHLLLTAGNRRAFGPSGIAPDQPHAPNGLERTGPGVSPRGRRRASRAWSVPVSQIARRRYPGSPRAPKA